MDSFIFRCMMGGWAKYSTAILLLFMVIKTEQVESSNLGSVGNVIWPFI